MIERDGKRDLEVYYNLLDKIEKTWTIEEIEWYAYYVGAALVTNLRFSNFCVDYVMEINNILSRRREEEKRKYEVKCT